MTYLFQSLNQKLSSRFSKALTIGAVCLSTIVPVATPAVASEEVTLTYGAFARSIPINEFETLASTGKATGVLKELLKLAKEDPAEAQQFLTYNVNVDAITVDGALNTAPGKFLLSELAKVVHTHNDRSNVQALRSALVLSASQNDGITLLEVLQNYPTTALYIDGIQLKKDIKETKSLLGSVHNYLSHLECGCSSQPTATAPTGI